MTTASFSVGRRLGLGFTIIIVIFLCVGWAGLFTGNKLKNAEKMNTHTYEVLEGSDAMLIAMINMETGARGFLLGGEDRFLEPFNNGLKDFGQSWDKLKKLTSDNPVQQKRLDEMKARHLEFKSVAESMFSLRRSVTSGTKTLPDLIADFAKGRDKAAMDGFRQLAADFSKMEQDLLTIRMADAQAMQALNRNSIIGGSLLALLLGAVLGVINTRAITLPLSKALDITKAVSSGYLATNIEITGNDEMTQLLIALKAMQSNLASVVGGVRKSAEEVSNTSNQIAQNNSDLSQRTEDQASTLEETSASMEELGSTVQQNAENARQANQLAQGASTVAAKGGEVINQVVQTMKGINDSSKRIADILGVIDGIAFQTNILALNAAVEAARAGEQGRGFAVVATEVRALAQRSADAAREIKSLINASVERVGEGTLLVDKAGTTMEEIVTAIRQVSDIMSEISAASDEQSIGVKQIGEAVSQMDQVTQKNAALVGESSAAAESLLNQAQQLVDAVAVFKLHNTTLALLPSR